MFQHSSRFPLVAEQVFCDLKEVEKDCEDEEAFAEEQIQDIINKFEK